MTTTEGVVGVGEASTNGGDPRALVRLMAETVAPRVTGLPLKDAWDLTGQGGGDHTENAYAAMAAVSQAALDIMGKELGLPCWRMLNDVQSDAPTEIRTYASGGMSHDDQPLELLLEEVQEMQSLGFTAWKFRPPIAKGASHQQRNISPPAFDHQKFIRISQAIRQAVGDSFLLMVDLGCRVHAVDEAKLICDALTELDFFMVEEPLPRIASKYAALRAETGVAIAGGEVFCSWEQCEEWIESSLDIVQPDASLAGMPNALLTARAAEKRGLIYIPHNWANGVANAANIHLAAAMPGNCPMIESSVVYNPLRELLVNEPLTPRRGTIQVPAAPGLGVTLNEDAIDSYRMD